jgi:hypothetical protein
MDIFTIIQNTIIYYVDKFKKLYTDFNGYICKNFWPSYHLGGGTNKNANSDGWRKNEWGGYTLTIETFLEDTGISFDDITFANPQIYSN